MSYNCDTWKTKELRDLRLPISSLFKHGRQDWHPKRINNDDGTVEFRIMEGVFVRGTIDGNVLDVSAIACHGEGSGTAMNWILEPALNDSTGRMVASCVWEGGDSVNRIIVENGSVSWVDVEI
jgi:hypothetical protein